MWLAARNLNARSLLRRNAPSELQPVDKPLQTYQRMSVLCLMVICAAAGREAKLEMLFEANIGDTSKYFKNSKKNQTGRVKFVPQSPSEMKKNSRNR